MSDSLKEKIQILEKQIAEITSELNRSDFLSSHQIKVFKTRRTSLKNKLKIYKSWIKPS
jgi:hypothetical protein